MAGPLTGLGPMATPSAIVLSLLVLSTAAYAQVPATGDETTPFQELAASLGAGTSTHGVAISGSLSLPTGPGDLGLRITSSGFGDESAGDLGLLYGFRLATGSGRLWARASAGPAWATWTVAGEPYNCRTEGAYPLIYWEACDQDWIDQNGIALAFQVDGAWELGESWGLATTWFSSAGGPRGFHGWSVNFFWRPLNKTPAPVR